MALDRPVQAEDPADGKLHETMYGRTAPAVAPGLAGDGDLEMKVNPPPPSFWEGPAGGTRPPGPPPAGSSRRGGPACGSEHHASNRSSKARLPQGRA